MVSTTSTQTTAAAAAAPKITWPRAPFPDDTPSHALLVVDFLKVQAGDAAEIETLYKACSTIGFFCTCRCAAAPLETQGPGFS